VSGNYRFGQVEIRIPERTLLIGGRPVELGARAFDVLRALVEHRDRVVTKDELMQIAWPGLVVEENNLQVQVSALRKLLGPQAITTIPGRGYQFSMSKDTSDEPSNGASQESVTRNGDLPGAGARPLSIAILPFSNLTGDPNQGYVADAISAAVTADLSRIRDAFIVDAATAFTYKDKPVTTQQFGRDLGVRFVLQGNVQRSGSKIRINAQLADATSNAQLWSETFEGDQSDLFALLDQVTSRIGNCIGREAVIVAARESETRKSSPKVADLLLRARAMYLKPKSPKNFGVIEALSRQALELEPGNASAMAILASALTLHVNNFASEMDANTREKKYAEGRDLAIGAKELDPGNPAIYGVLGMYARAHDDFAAYRRANETRLSLEPRNPSAYNNLAFSFIEGGEPQKAIELLKQAIDLEPKHPSELILLNMGEAYFMLGDNDATIEWFLKSLEINSAFPDPYAYLAMAYELKGEYSKARAAVDDLHRVSPNFKLTEFRTLGSSSPAAYKAWYEGKYLPFGRKAGLPE
jgi:TolB-like protein